jgi:AcrR family transcriptional regulator
MPRNRPERAREEKSAEIVAIAQRLFLERGYDGTTMAAVAREAGIATNVVHWYFATKDELFVAALDALQVRSLTQLQSRFVAHATPGDERSLLEALLTEFVCGRLAMYESIATVHERSRCSPVVAEFHERTHRRYAEHLDRAVAGCRIPVAERELVVENLVLALEGLVMHRVSRPKAKRMVSFLVRRLIPRDRRSTSP